MKRRTVLESVSMMLLATTTIVGVAVATVPGVMGGNEEASTLNIDDPSWQNVPAKEISLETAPSVHPAVAGTAQVSQLTVQTYRTRENVLIRVSWKDNTRNDKRGDVDQFVDGVAVQFPLGRDRSTSPMMGGAGKVVNIWHWRADTNSATDMIANGFGTVTEASVQSVQANGRHKDGEWTVVFRRSQEGTFKQSVKLKKKTKQPIAFAVWDGAHRERDGLKVAQVSWETITL